MKKHLLSFALFLGLAIAAEPSFAAHPLSGQEQRQDDRRRRKTQHQIVFQQRQANISRINPTT